MPESGMNLSKDYEAVLAEARRALYHNHVYLNIRDQVQKDESRQVYCDYKQLEVEVAHFRNHFGFSGMVWREDFMKSELVPEEIKEYFRNKVKLMIPELIVNDDWLSVKSLSRFSGDYEEIMAYIKKKGVFTSPGLNNVDLLDAVLVSGNGRQINRAMHEFMCASKMHNWSFLEHNLDGESCQLAEIIGRIKRNLDIYDERNGIESKTYTGVFHVHSAMEISRMNYDLIVGIYRGCTSLTTPLEVIGDNVRYIDYSKTRNSGEDPKWLAVGRVVGQPQAAQNVLVCEDDAVTGDSLSAVVPLLRELDPERVDVRFGGQNLDTSWVIARSIPFYNNVRGIRFPFKRFVGNLRNFDAKLKKVLKRNSTK